ncbi:MAG: histidine kinase dimerization/phospho-acceptor domain-containing protein [Chloroflexia bacterium]
MPREVDHNSLWITNRVLKDLAPCLDQAELLRLLRQLLQELVPHDAAMVLRVDGTDPVQLEPAELYGMGEVVSLPTPLLPRHLIDPWSWDEGPLHIPDLQESSAQFGDLFAEHGLRALLSIPVPLPGNTGTAAVLLLAHREPGAFAGISDESVEELRQAVAVPMANALEVSRQQQESRAMLDQAAAIWDGAESGGDLSRSLAKLLEQAVSITEADAGTIMVVDPENGKLYVRAARGLDTEQTAGEQLPWGSADAAPVYAMTAPRFLRHLGEPGTTEKIGVAAEAGFKTYLGLPVRRSHSRLASGLLNLYWHSDVEVVPAEKLMLLRSLSRAIAAVQQSSEAEDRQANYDRTIDEFHQHRARLLALTGHQLRTPITSISGYAQLLLRHTTDPASSTARYAATILSESRRLDGLVSNLLELSRLEDALLGVQTRSFDLRALLDDMRRDSSALNALNGVQLAWELPETLPIVVGDPLRLRQALLGVLRRTRTRAPENAPPLPIRAKTTEWEGKPVVEIGIGAPLSGGAKKDVRGLIDIRKIVDSPQAQDDELALYTALELLTAMGAGLYKVPDTDDGEHYTILMPVLKED